MKPLIPLDSPTYLRRLVRALNTEADTGNGFYLASGGTAAFRCNRARLSGGKLQVWALGYGWSSGEGQSSFCDAYGREIVASRQA